MRIILFVFVSLFSCLGHCQSDAEECRAVVSARDVSCSSVQDTAVCSAFLHWGEIIYSNNSDSALLLWENAAAIAALHIDEDLPEKLHQYYLTAMADALHSIGFIYNYQGNKDSAAHYYTQGLVYQKMLPVGEGLANAYNNIGNFYSIHGNVTLALEYLFKSLKIYEQIEHTFGVSTAYHSIGNLYDFQGETKEALTHYLKAVDAFDSLERAQIAMGDTYWNISECYAQLDDQTNRIIYLKKAANSYFIQHNSFGDASGYYTLGDIHYALNNLDSAIHYYKTSAKIYLDIGRSVYVSWAYREIGRCLLEQGNPRQAIPYLDSSKFIAQTIETVEELMKTSEVYVEVFTALEMYQEALASYELTIKLKDSINNQNNQKATIRQATKYEYEKADLVKKQAAMERDRLIKEELNRRDNLQYSVILIALLLVFGGVLSLGVIMVSPKVAEGLIFFSFLILFEFILVLADPYVDDFSEGAPGYKLLFNAVLAGLIFPLHSWFETLLKKKLITSKRRKH